MGRILAIDYGTKRTGIAVTDPLKLIATSLETVATGEALNYIKDYTNREMVEAMVIGIPRHLNNNEAELMPVIEKFIEKLNESCPNIPIHRYDERFTSLMAQKSLIESGQSRKTRRDKSVLDRISATILLQSWLEHQQFRK